MWTKVVNGKKSANGNYSEYLISSLEDFENPLYSTSGSIVYLPNKKNKWIYNNKTWFADKNNIIKKNYQVIMDYGSWTLGKEITESGTTDKEVLYKDITFNMAAQKIDLDISNIKFELFNLKSFDYASVVMYTGTTITKVQYSKAKELLFTDWFVPGCTSVRFQLYKHGIFGSHDVEGLSAKVLYKDETGEYIDPNSPTVFYDFISSHNLDTLGRQDIESFLFSSEVKYFTTFPAAIDFINNNIGGSSESTGAVCAVYRSSKMTILKLLSDISIPTSSVSLHKSIIIDFYNYVLTIKRINVEENISLCLYGKLTNSKLISVVGIYAFYNTDSSTNIYSYGMKFSIYYNASEIVFSNFNTRFCNTIHIADCNFNYTDTNTKSEIDFMFISYSKNVLIENCNAYINLPRRTYTSTNHTFECIYATPALNSFIIRNCNFESVCTNAQNMDYESFGITINSKSAEFSNFKAPVYIENSTIKGQSVAVMTQSVYYADFDIYVYNSFLSGADHGCIYSTGGGKTGSDGGHGATFHIQDSTCKVHSEGTGQNGYACYVGYNSHVYFDNVRFEGTNGSLGSPAVKTGNESSRTYSDTRVYMSNCSMSSLRLDSGTYAYLGKGMDTIKQSTVSGTKIDEGNKEYNHRAKSFVSNGITWYTNNGYSDAGTAITGTDIVMSEARAVDQNCVVKLNLSGTNVTRRAIFFNTNDEWIGYGSTVAGSAVPQGATYYRLQAKSTVSGGLINKTWMDARTVSFEEEPIV